jgi:phage shock protein C
MKTRLMRSRADRMVGGVCGGLAAYLRIDATIIRLLFVLMALGSGAGVFIYLVLWFVLPSEGVTESASLDANIRASAEEIAERARSLGADLRSQDSDANRRGLMVVGAGLILVGAVVFLNNLNIPWLAWLKVDLLWPLALVAAGVLVIVRYLKGE